MFSLGLETVWDIQSTNGNDNVNRQIYSYNGTTEVGPNSTQIPKTN